MASLMFDHEKPDVYQLELKRVVPGKEMLVRFVAMLTKLVERFDPESYRVREDESVVIRSEDDDEHEDETSQ